MQGLHIERLFRCTLDTSSGTSKCVVEGQGIDTKNYNLSNKHHDLASQKGRILPSKEEVQIQIGS